MGANKTKVEAKNGLEDYCFTMRNTLQEEKLKDKFEAGDKDKIEKAVQDSLDWLDKNQLAEKDEFEAKQKELEGVVNPIMMKAINKREAKVVCPTCREACLVEEWAAEAVEAPPWKRWIS